MYFPYHNRSPNVNLFTILAKAGNIGNLSRLSNALGGQIEFSAMADNRLHPLQPFATVSWEGLRN